MEDEGRNADLERSVGEVERRLDGRVPVGDEDESECREPRRQQRQRWTEHEADDERHRTEIERVSLTLERDVGHEQVGHHEPDDEQPDGHAHRRRHRLDAAGDGPDGGGGGAQQRDERPDRARGRRPVRHRPSPRATARATPDAWAV